MCPPYLRSPDSSRGDSVGIEGLSSKRFFVVAAGAGGHSPTKDCYRPFGGPPMSAFRVLIVLAPPNVRYWGQSGRSGMTLWMSAYSQKRTFAGKADLPPRSVPIVNLVHYGCLACSASSGRKTSEPELHGLPQQCRAWANRPGLSDGLEARARIEAHRGSATCDSEI